VIKVPVLATATDQRRSGAVDEPTEPSEPPRGHFVVGIQDGDPVACGALEARCPCGSDPGALLTDYAYSVICDCSCCGDAVVGGAVIYDNNFDVSEGLSKYTGDGATDNILTVLNRDNYAEAGRQAPRPVQHMLSLAALAADVADGASSITERGGEGELGGGNERAGSG